MKWLHRCLLILVYLGSARMALAAGPEERESARLALESGIQLFREGKFEQALDQFLLSRSKFPNGANTFNAAMSLQELGRLDEAHELFEETLSQYAQEISETNQRSIAKVLSEITAQTGVVTLKTNLIGLSLTVDGTSRTLRSNRIRLLPGQHALRLNKAGFRGTGVSVIIQANKNTSVDVDMRPVGAWLSVHTPHPDGQTNGESWKLLLDGSDAGPLPWDGGVGIGKHVVQIVGGPRAAEGVFTMGSDLVAVNAQEGEIALLDPPVRQVSRVELRSVPENAEIFVNSVFVGTSVWSGYLPHGNYQVYSTLSGYLPYYRTIGVPAETPVTLQLSADLSDARWRKPKMFRVDAMGTALVGATLGARSFFSCGSNCEPSRPVLGYFSGATLAFQFSQTWSTTLSAAWGVASEKTKRSVDVQGSHSYTLLQANWISGPLVMLGINHTPAKIWGASLGLGIDAGVWVIRTRQLTRGVLVDGNDVVGVSVESEGNATTAPLALVQPTMLLSWSSMGMDFGVRAGTLIFVSNAPALSQGELTVTRKPNNCSVTSKSPQCSANSAALQGESSAGRTLLGSLAFSMGYRFL